MAQNVKVISAPTPAELEAGINAFLATVPSHKINNVVQSESVTADGVRNITLTLLSSA